MDLILHFVILAVLLVLSGFFSGAETALTSLGRLRTAGLVEEDPVRYGRLKYWLDHPNRMLTTILIGNNVVNIGAASVATVTVNNVLSHFGVTGSEQLVVAVTTGAMTLLVLAFGEITPKTYARSNAVPISRFALVPLVAMARVLGPLIALMMGLTAVILRLLGGHKARGEPIVVTEQFLRSLLRQSEQEGTIAAMESRMISSIFRFNDILVREAMVPRTELTFLPIDSTLRDCIGVAIHSGHSRIPVYDEAIDNVVGLLHVKDLLETDLREEDAFALSNLIRPTHFVPESTPVSEILRLLQRERMHMAMVIDEYGGIAGLVTLEDILEEIVGEIFDEFDTEETMLKVIRPGSDYLIDGRMEIRDFNRRLHAKLPHEDVETMAGLVAQEMGKIPNEGESIELDGLRLVVTKASSRRIEQLRVTLRPVSD